MGKNTSLGRVVADGSSAVGHARVGGRRGGPGTSGNSASIGSSRQNFHPSSHRDGVDRPDTQPVSPFVRQLWEMTLCRILKIGPWRHVPSGIHHYDLTRPIVIVPVLA